MSSTLNITPNNNNDSNTVNIDNNKVNIDLLLRIRSPNNFNNPNNNSLYDGEEYIFNNKAICVQLVENNNNNRLGETLRISFNDNNSNNRNVAHNYFTSPTPISAHNNHNSSNDNNKVITIATFEKVT